ncbi:MAG: hypothetical protein WD602_01385 [Actinomycetota bacterium]
MAVQLMLASVLVVDAPAPDVSRLTDYGAFLFRPEIDVALYLASTVAAVTLILAFTLRLNVRLRSVDPRAADGFLLHSLLAQSFTAIAATAASTAIFFSAREYLQTDSTIPAGHFALFGLVAAVCLVAAATGGPGGTQSKWAARFRRLLQGDERIAPPALKRSWWDLATPVGLAAMFYVPSWRQAAGDFFLTESLFHWDYYAMGPTLGFHHGLALGTDVSSMYGVGWPLVFSALFSWVPPSYGRMIQVGSVYACIYLTGIYVLLRLLIRRPLPAAIGTGLVSLQMLVGMGEVPIWLFPSLTPMRFAFDVWCFIALAMHQRTRRRLWAAVAGAAAGLAVAFGTDTGLYLGAACGFYWVCTAWMEGRWKERFKDLAAFGVTSVGILLAVLTVAGRGRILIADFWLGWLESILEFGGGFAQLPLATVPNTVTVVSFLAIFFAYVTFVGYCVVRLAHGRAGHFEVFNGFLAVYGLLLLMHFLGRSGDYTPARLWIPLALIVIHLAGRTYDHAAARREASTQPAGARRRAAGWATSLAAGLLIVSLLLAAPPSLIVDPVRNYPGLAASQLHGTQPDGLCLLLNPADLCGLPEDMEQMATEFRAVAGQLRNLADAGMTLAVIDETGSLFYLAADTAPWSRYPRLFVSLHTQHKLAEVVERLRNHPPDYVLTRMPTSVDSAHLQRYPPSMFGLGPHPHTPYADTWRRLGAVVSERYALESTTGPFELYRHN